MEHVLTECNKPGQCKIWALAQTLWKLCTDHDWITPSLGLILSYGLARMFDAHNKIDKPLMQFFQILTSESAYLIWKLRCETPLSNADLSATQGEIHNRWVHTINEQLTIDHMLSSTQKLGPRTLSHHLLVSTWCGALLNEDSLPKNWLTKRDIKVLVGIEPMRRTLPNSNHTNDPLNPS